MERLVRSVASLRRTGAGALVASRMEEFRSKGRQSENEIFKELCFCLLTANYSAEGGMRIQKVVGDGFITLPERPLASRLKSCGHRFPNARARYIVEARKQREGLKEALSSAKTAGVDSAREWLANNILGLGYKEASHFLRNIGHGDFAIIDFHIIDLLARHRIIHKPKGKSLDKKRYLEIERKLGRLAARCGMCQGELDLYLWYLETGKILK